MTQKPRMPKPTTFSAEEIALYQDELRKAATRIDETPGASMGWLTCFSQMKLPELSTGQWTDLCYEINVFGDSVLPGTARFPILPSYGLSIGDWEGNMRCAEEDIELLMQEASRNQRLSLRLPPRTKVEELQEEVSHLLDTFLRDDRCRLPLPKIDLNIIRFPDLDQSLTQLIVVRPQELFTYNISLLICSHALRIRRCPECARIFLQDRKNQSYCSVRCQNRVASRKYLATPKDRIGKRGRPPKGISPYSGGSWAASTDGASSVVSGGAAAATGDSPSVVSGGVATSKTISPKTGSRKT